MNSCAFNALAAFVILQVVSACKNCVLLGKEERAMFRLHSAACGAQSGAGRAAEALLAGELRDEPALRAHVYCLLRMCKIIAKDGKLLKSALSGKLANKMDALNTTKVLENCAEKASDASSPEDVAWNLFRCAYERKAGLLDYMPTHEQPAAVHE